MTSNKKDPVIVVLQLSGGNDYANTVIRYNDPLYRDNRPGIGIPEDQVLRIDDEIGLHPSMGPVKYLYDQGPVGNHPRRGISQLPTFPFPLHGYMAHL